MEVPKDVADWVDKFYGKIGRRFVPNLQNPLENILNSVIKNIYEMNEEIKQIKLFLEKLDNKKPGRPPNGINNKR